MTTQKYNSREADMALEAGFEEWLGWPTTLMMAIDVAYEHGDIVRVESVEYFKDTTLRRMLLAAYSAGQMNMAIFLGAISE